MDDKMTPKARFFVEDIQYATDDDVIQPGERGRFAAQPQLSWTPDSLTIVAFSQAIVSPNSDDQPVDPGHAPVSELTTPDVPTGRGGLFARLTTLFRSKKQLAPPIVWHEPPPPPPPPAWELQSLCPVRLCALELAGHTVEFTENNFGPKIDLSGKRLRRLSVAEALTCVLENTSDTPVRVKLGYEGHSGEDHAPLGAMARLTTERRRRFEVPPKMGPIDLIWNAPWVFRATRIWCHSKDSRGDLALLDVRVGNRSQMLGNAGLPVEMLEDGIDVSFSSVVVSQHISFVVENQGNETKHVEFEMEGFAIDDGPFEPNPNDAPTGPSVPSGGALSSPLSGIDLASAHETLAQLQRSLNHS